MRYVQQSTISGNIVVQKDDVVYSDTNENFEKDMGLTAPSLPEWAEDRVYEPGIRHAIHTRDGSRMEGGDDPWEEGDRIIEDIELAVESKVARESEEQRLHFEESERKRLAWEQEQYENFRREREQADADERARPKSKEELKQYTAQIRFTKQLGGFTSASYGAILTDTLTTATITGLVVSD